MIIITVLKSNLRVKMEQSLGQWVRPGSWVGLTQVSIRVKNVIMIVLKPDPRSISGKPGSRVGLTIDPG
jgi:hypothetical protein